MDCEKFKIASKARCDQIRARGEVLRHLPPHVYEGLSLREIMDQVCGNQAPRRGFAITYSESDY